MQTPPRVPLQEHSTPNASDGPSQRGRSECGSRTDVCVCVGEREGVREREGVCERKSM